MRLLLSVSLTGSLGFAFGSTPALIRPTYSGSNLAGFGDGLGVGFGAGFGGCGGASPGYSSAGVFGGGASPGNFSAGVLPVAFGGGASPGNCSAGVFFNLPLSVVSSHEL